MPVTPKYRKSRRRPDTSRSPSGSHDRNHSRDFPDLSPDAVYRVQPDSGVNLAFTGCPCHSPKLHLEDYDECEKNSNHYQRSSHSKKPYTEKRIHSKRYNTQDSEYHNVLIKSGHNAHAVGSSSHNDVRSKSHVKSRNSARQSSPLSYSAPSRDDDRYDTSRTSRGKPKLHKHRYNESCDDGERYSPSRSLKPRTSSPQRPDGDNDIDSVKRVDYESSRKRGSAEIYSAESSNTEVFSLIQTSPDAPWCQHCCERCCPDGCSRRRCRSRSKPKNLSHTTVDRMFEDVFKSLVESDEPLSYIRNKPNDKNFHNSFQAGNSCEYEVTDVDDPDFSSDVSPSGSKEDIRSQPEVDCRDDYDENGDRGAVPERINTTNQASGTPKIFFAKNQATENEYPAQPLFLSIEEIPQQSDNLSKSPNQLVAGSEQNCWIKDEECGSSVDCCEVNSLVYSNQQAEDNHIVVQEQCLEEPGVVLVSLKDGHIRFTPNKTSDNSRPATPSQQNCQNLQGSSVDMAPIRCEPRTDPDCSNRQDCNQFINLEESYSSSRACKERPTSGVSPVQDPLLSCGDVSSTDISERHSLEICENTLDALVKEGVGLISKLPAEVESVADDQNTTELGSVSCSELGRCSRQDRDDVSCHDDVSSSAPGKTHSLLTACDGMSDSNVHEVMAIISEEVHIKRYPSVPDLTDLNDDDDPTSVTRDPTVGSRDIPTTSRDPALVSRDLPTAARDPALVPRDLPTACSKSDKVLEVGENGLPPNTPWSGTLPGSGYVETMVSLYESSFALTKDPPLGMFKERQPSPLRSIKRTQDFAECKQNFERDKQGDVDCASDQSPTKKVEISDSDITLPSPPNTSPGAHQTEQAIQESSKYVKQSLSPSSSTNYINIKLEDKEDTNNKSGYSPVPKPCTEHLNSYDLLLDNMSSTCDVSLSNFVDSTEERHILACGEYQREYPPTSNSSFAQQSVQSEASECFSGTGETKNQGAAILSSNSGFGDCELRTGAITADGAAIEDDAREGLQGHLVSLGTDDCEGSCEQQAIRVSSGTGFGDAGEVKSATTEVGSHVGDDFGDNLSSCLILKSIDNTEDLPGQRPKQKSVIWNDEQDHAYEKTLASVWAVRINDKMMEVGAKVDWEETDSYAADDEEESSSGCPELILHLDNIDNSCEGLCYGSDGQDVAYERALKLGWNASGRESYQSGVEQNLYAEDPDCITVDDVDDISMSRCPVSISVDEYEVSCDQRFHLDGVIGNDNQDALYEKSLLTAWSGTFDDSREYGVMDANGAENSMFRCHLTTASEDYEASCEIRSSRFDSSRINDEQCQVSESVSTRKRQVIDAKIKCLVEVRAPCEEEDSASTCLLSIDNAHSGNRSPRVDSSSFNDEQYFAFEKALTNRKFKVAGVERKMHSPAVDIFLTNSAIERPVSSGRDCREHYCQTQAHNEKEGGNDDPDVCYEKALFCGPTDDEDHGKAAHVLRKQILQESKHSGGLLKGTGTSGVSLAGTNRRSLDFAANADNPFKQTSQEGKSVSTFSNGVVCDDPSKVRRMSLHGQPVGTVKKNDRSLDRLQSDAKTRRNVKIGDAAASDRSNSCCLQMRHHFPSSADNRAWHLGVGKKAYDCSSTFCSSEQPEQKEYSRKIILKEIINDYYYQSSNVSPERQAAKPCASLSESNGKNTTMKQSHQRCTGQVKPVLKTNKEKDSMALTGNEKNRQGQVSRSVSQPVPRRKKAVPKYVKRAKTVVVTTHSVVRGVPCPREADHFRHTPFPGAMVTIETKYPYHEQRSPFRRRRTPEPDTDTESSSRTLIDNVGECWSSPERDSSSTTLTQDDFLDIPDLPGCPEVYKLNETNNFPRNYSPTFQESVVKLETDSGAQQTAETSFEGEPLRFQTDEACQTAQAVSKETRPNVGFLHVVKIDGASQEQYTRRVGSAASADVKTVSLTSLPNTDPTLLNKSENHCSESSHKLNDFSGRRPSATPALILDYPINDLPISKRSCSCDDSSNYYSWRSLKDTKTSFKNAHTLPNRIQLAPNSAICLRPKEPRYRSVDHSSRLARGPLTAAPKTGKPGGNGSRSVEGRVPSNQVPVCVTIRRQSNKAGLVVRSPRVDKPVHTSRVDQPVCASRVNQPVRSSGVNQPGCGSKVDQSVCSSGVNQPVCSSKVNSRQASVQNREEVPRRRHEIAHRAQRHVEKCDNIIARSNRRIELSKALVETSKQQIRRAKKSLDLS